MAKAGAQSDSDRIREYALTMSPHAVLLPGVAGKSKNMYNGNRYDYYNMSSNNPVISTDKVDSMRRSSL